MSMRPASILAAFHYFGIASDDLYAGLFGGVFDAQQDIPEFAHGQAFFQDKCQ